MEKKRSDQFVGGSAQKTVEVGKGIYGTRLRVQTEQRRNIELHTKKGGNRGGSKLLSVKNFKVRTSEIMGSRKVRRKKQGKKTETGS